MFGVRALILKGVEKWSYQPRLLGFSRPSNFTTRESSTLCLETQSQSTQPTPVGDSEVRQGYRFRHRLPREGFAAPNSRPKHSFPIRAGHRSYIPKPVWALSDFLLHHEHDRLHEISAEGHPLRALARDTSGRLSPLLAYAILRHLVDLGKLDPAWVCDLETPEQFEARITNSPIEWITPELLSHWAWIALTKDPDTRARRFALSTYPKPWLLFSVCLLRLRHQYASRESLVYMVDHVVQWQARFSQEANHNPSTFHLESNRFALAIGWLVRKCLIVWPDLLPNLARPTADFIKSIPLVASRNRYTHGYKCQCHIFNSAIESLGEEPAADRQRAREFCWEAQKILLECSSTSHRQLIISRNSYRSIRMVMLSLKKTALETKVAIRSSTSWPPYRKVWDGTDERRKPEDDLSRASQAGILMHEAGYSSDWDDEAMTVLGGSFSGRPPTVQTRTLDFKFSDNPDTLWIARINATRNAREAWGVFQSPPVSGMLPTTGVYAAMFAKLYSPPVDMAGVVPGDTTRVFPVDNGNLSPFAITSLEPPDPKSLYQRMLNQRLAPTGLCLQLLIRNADDIEEAMEYFRKSPYSSAAPVLEVSLEALSESDLNDFDNPSLHWKRKMLSSIPPGILAAWISALCRIRPNWRRLIRPCYISNAVFLARLHKSTTPPGSRDSAPLFREIATFLGRGKMVRPTRGEHKAASTLRVFLVVYSQFSFVCKGADERMFQAFCLILQKTVRSFLFLTKAGSQKVKTRGWRRATERVHSETFLLEPCCNGVVQEFKLLVQPLDTDKTTPSIIYPHPRFPLRTAVTLQLYMRALAAFGNAEEMVRVVEWLFDSYETGLVFSRELMTPGAYEYRVLVNTLAYFDCIIEKLGDSSTQRHLRERLQFLQDERGCTWYLHELQENLRQCIEEDLLCAKAYKGLTAGWTSSSLPSRATFGTAETAAGPNAYRLESSSLGEERNGKEEEMTS